MIRAAAVPPLISPASAAMTVNTNSTAPATISEIPINNANQPLGALTVRS